MVKAPPPMPPGRRSAPPSGSGEEGAQGQTWQRDRRALASDDEAETSQTGGDRGAGAALGPRQDGEMRAGRSVTVTHCEA